ncbi:hypothetical protein VNO77_02863 [Canavalia gladiata]|uniref:Uncharacterized protein n=1 Tax=Canavalia gladiata TaxID=3824 RepID=A0AAN9MYZ0_CANGL
MEEVLELAFIKDVKERMAGVERLHQVLELHFNALVLTVIDRLSDVKKPVRNAARRLLLTLVEISSPTITVERVGSFAWTFEYLKLKPHIPVSRSSNLRSQFDEYGLARPNYDIQTLNTSAGGTSLQFMVKKIAEVASKESSDPRLPLSITEFLQETVALCDEERHMHAHLWTNSGDLPSF